ncbi:hypothetical protein EDD90_6073 [Streptomyces sp. Ag109_O5-1]|nr:hypothetical protein EDD90_6073 [Streptomyces sp. Ag109_O5-1]
MVTTRAAGAADSSGISHRVNAKCPRWFVPNMSSWPSPVSSRGGSSSATPALWTTASRRSTFSDSTTVRNDERSARSSRTARTWAPGTRARIDAMAASAFVGLRLPSTTVAPVADNCSATKYPMPALPPVMRKTLPSARGSRWTFQGGVDEVEDVDGMATGLPCW